jgi:hypothetical protein
MYPNRIGFESRRRQAMLARCNGRTEETSWPIVVRL